MVEIWKPIAEFDGAYQASNLGRIRDAKSGYVYDPMLPASPRSYMAVSLWHEGKRKRRNVHVLVAITFHGPRPSPQHQVRHLNGNRGNNAKRNLAWGTPQDNTDDRARHGRTCRGETHGMFGHGLHGTANGNARLTDAQAAEIRQLSGILSQRAIGRKYGVHQAVVWRIINGQSYPAALKARPASGGMG